MRVLLIRVDAAFRPTLGPKLTGMGFQVAECRAGGEAVALPAHAEPAVALLCAGSLTHEAIELVRHLRYRDRRTELVVTATQSAPDFAEQVIRAGAYDFLLAPTDDQAILDMILRAARRVGRSGPPKFFMVGSSPAMTALYKSIAHVANLPMPVLLQGELGCGKQTLARAIHAAGAQHDRPFVSFDPGPIREEEANRALAIALESAAGGTLHVREVTDLPLGTQSRLLRSIEGGEGRIIAATIKNLDEEVRAGRVRSDLGLRLLAVSIIVPPLRDRPGDVALLTQHLIRKCASEMKRPVESISRDAAAHLERYSWPGNVRELSHIIQRAVAFTEGTRIEPPSLPARLRDEFLPMERTRRGGALASLAEVERDHILAVLRTMRGNRVRAAAQLGIDRKTLYRKLKSYGVALPAEHETNGVS